MHSLQLAGMTAAPQRHADALIEHPTHRQVDHAPLEEILGQLIELLTARRYCA